MTEKIKFVQGNEACVEGALYAGVDFFAGYPITPVHKDCRGIVQSVCRKRGGKFYSDGRMKLPSMGANHRGHS